MKLKLPRNSDGSLIVNRLKIFTLIVQMHSTVSQKMSSCLLKEETRVHGFQSFSNSDNEKFYFINCQDLTRINSLQSFSTLLCHRGEFARLTRLMCQYNIYDIQLFLCFTTSPVYKVLR